VIYNSVTQQKWASWLFNSQICCSVFRWQGKCCILRRYPKVYHSCIIC